MKCRICGAKLKRDGDICKSCYEEYRKEEELEKDTKVVYKIYRKHLPLYQLIQYFDWYVAMIIIVVVLMVRAQYALTIFSLIMGLVMLGLAMFLAKRKAVNTTCTFFEKKIVWKYKDRKKTIAYSDLKDVTYYQNFFQKVFKLADVQFRPESGTYLLDGFEVKNVPDFDNTWEKIEEIILSKREK